MLEAYIYMMIEYSALHYVGHQSSPSCHRTKTAFSPTRVHTLHSTSTAPHLSREALPLSTRLTPRASRWSPRVASRRSLGVAGGSSLRVVSGGSTLCVARGRRSVRVDNRATVGVRRLCTASRGLGGSAGSGSLWVSGGRRLFSRGLRSCGSARGDRSGSGGGVGRSAAGDAGS